MNEKENPMTTNVFVSDPISVKRGCCPLRQAPNFEGESENGS
jgi:hypothetical protein